MLRISDRYLPIRRSLYCYCEVLKVQVLKEKKEKTNDRFAISVKDSVHYQAM